MKKIKLTKRQRYLLRRDGEFRIGLSGNSKQRRKTKRAIARSGNFEIVDLKHYQYKDVVVKRINRSDR